MVPATSNAHQHISPESVYCTPQRAKARARGREGGGEGRAGGREGDAKSGVVTDVTRTNLVKQDGKDDHVRLPFRSAEPDRTDGKTVSEVVGKVSSKVQVAGDGNLAVAFVGARVFSFAGLFGIGTNDLLFGFRSCTRGRRGIVSSRTHGGLAVAVAVSVILPMPVRMTY